MNVGARFWLGAVGTESGSAPHEHEDQQRKRAHGDPDDRREDDPLHPGWERGARARIESRLSPEHSECEEGDDEHGRATEEEEPPGYREVTDSAEAVGRGRGGSDERNEDDRAGDQGTGTELHVRCSLSADSKRRAARAAAVPGRIDGPDAEAQRGTRQDGERHSPRKEVVEDAGLDVVEPPLHGPQRLAAAVDGGPLPTAAALLGNPVPQPRYPAALTGAR